MMRAALAILLSMAIAFPAYGRCDKPVHSVTEGENFSVPCDGYFFTAAKELELRLKFKTIPFLEEEAELKDNLIRLYKMDSEARQQIIDKERQKAELWRDLAEKNTLTLVDLQEKQDRRDWLFFAGGILCTVAAGFAIGQASK